MENSKKINILEILTAISFVLIGASLRLLPHPANFAPISAIALFGAVYLSRKTALILPIAAMMISDAFIGFYEPKLMFFVYGSFLLCVFLGFWLKKHKEWYTVVESALISSVLFFLITNFAVWIFTPWYTKSFEGILKCYLMALPFFKNSLIGDLFYTTLFFSSYELASFLIRKKLETLEEIKVPFK